MDLTPASKISRSFVSFVDLILSHRRVNLKIEKDKLQIAHIVQLMQHNICFKRHINAGVLFKSGKGFQRGLTRVRKDVFKICFKSAFIPDEQGHSRRTMTVKVRRPGSSVSFLSDQKNRNRRAFFAKCCLVVDVWFILDFDGYNPATN